MLMLFIILECSSVYHCVWGRADLKYYLELDALIFGTLLLFLLLGKEKKRWKSLRSVCPLLCLILCFENLFLFFNARKTWATDHYIIAFLMFLPLMLCIFQVYHSIGIPYRLIYVLSDIVFVLAAASVVIWIATVSGKLQPTGDIIVDWAYARETKNYFNLCFYHQMERIPLLGWDVVRNTGIFPESPMYNIFLNSALYTELFLRNKTQWLKCAVFTLTICTTIGTLGILLCVVGWTIKLFSIIKRSRFKYLAYIILLSAVIIGGILIQQKWYYGNSSFFTHIDDFAAPVKAWKERPILGCGYDDESFIQNFMSSFRRDNLGLSNSVGIVLAEGGIFFFLFYLLPFLFQMINGIKLRKINIAWWVFGIWGIFCTTVFQYRFYMIFLLALGYSFTYVCFRKTEKTELGGTSPNIDAAGEKSRNLLLYIITALLGICAAASAFIQPFNAFITNVFKRYRLGLEESQWRAVILVMLLLICGGTVKYTIETIKENKYLDAEKKL